MKQALKQAPRTAFRRMQDALHWLAQQVSRIEVAAGLRYDPSRAIQHPFKTTQPTPRRPAPTPPQDIVYFSSQHIPFAYHEEEDTDAAAKVIVFERIDTHSPTGIPASLDTYDLEAIAQHKFREELYRKVKASIAIGHSIASIVATHKGTRGMGKSRVEQMSAIIRRNPSLQDS